MADIVKQQFYSKDGVWIEVPLAPTSGSGSMGPTGPAGADGATGPSGPPGPTAVSVDAGNIAATGTDGLVFVPPQFDQVAADPLYVNVTGDTMTGALNVLAPSAAAHPLRKQDFDDHVAAADPHPGYVTDAEVRGHNYGTMAATSAASGGFTACNLTMTSNLYCPHGSDRIYMDKAGFYSASCFLSLGVGASGRTFVEITIAGNVPAARASIAVGEDGGGVAGVFWAGASEFMQFRLFHSQGSTITTSPGQYALKYLGLA